MAQLRGGYAVFRRGACSQRRPSLWTFHGFVPVSYTHLDVYKRQAQGVLHRALLALVEFLKFHVRDPPVNVVCVAFIW